MATTRLPAWGWALSIAAHVAAVGLAVVSARQPSAKPPPVSEAPFIELETDAEAGGATRADDVAPRGASAHKPTSARAVRDDGDDGYLPRRKRAKHGDAKDAEPRKTDELAKALDQAAEKEAERAAMRDAVRKAMLAPGGTGGDVARPGAEGGSGGKKPGVSAKYAGMLDGWFSARVSLRGLAMPWDELKTLSTVVSIQLTPDRHVSGFSIVKSSGNGAYDARVSSSMQGVVGSGATLPPPPDDEDVPPQITLRFRCRSQERCS